MAVSGEIVGEASSARPQVSRVIDLAFAVDEQYIPHLTVALTSIARHAGKGVLCRCWVVCAVASWLEKPRSVLEQQGLPLDIRHLPVEQSVLADAPISRHISVASYQRLLIPSHLPQDISRVLYLDADLVVEADVTDLCDHPLGGGTIRMFSTPSSRTTGSRSSLAGMCKPPSGNVVLPGISPLKRLKAPSGIPASSITRDTASLGSLATIIRGAIAIIHIAISLQCRVAMGFRRRRRNWSDASRSVLCRADAVPGCVLSCA